MAYYAKNSMHLLLRHNMYDMVFHGVGYQFMLYR